MNMRSIELALASLEKRLTNLGECVAKIEGEEAEEKKDETETN